AGVELVAPELLSGHGLRRVVGQQVPCALADLVDARDGRGGRHPSSVRRGRAATGPGPGRGGAYPSSATATIGSGGGESASEPRNGSPEKSKMPPSAATMR